MAAETGFGDHQFSTLSSQQDSPTRRGGVTYKRKRESIDLDSPSRRHGSSSRGLEMSRRSSAQQHQFINSTPAMHDTHSTEGYIQAQHRGGSNVPIPSIEDHSNHHFDLSALQQHSNSAGSSHNRPSTPNTNMDTAAAALTQYSMSVPPHPAETFLNTPTAGADNFVSHNSLNFDGGNESGQDHNAMSNPIMKPAVGSEEWHRQRKDSHKEVERRRRETINEGINELAKIVPGVEKNKGTILQRAVQYIKSLHEDASTNIDRWTFEKLVTEQAITELSVKIQRAYDEREAWKRIAREAGVDVDNVDLGLDNSPAGPVQRQAMLDHDGLGHGSGSRGSPGGGDEDSDSGSNDSGLPASSQAVNASSEVSPDNEIMKVDASLRGIFPDSDASQPDTSSATAAAAVAAAAAAAAAATEDDSEKKVGEVAMSAIPATAAVVATGTEEETNNDGNEQVADPDIASTALSSSPPTASPLPKQGGSGASRARQSGRRGRTRT